MMTQAGRFATVALVVLVLFTVIKAASIYIIDEREQAVVTRFNRPVRVIVGDISQRSLEELRARIQDASTELSREEGQPSNIRVSQGAGFYFKMPFIDQVQRFPDILLELDASPRDVVLSDKKKLMLDNFARWYIENPLLYRIRVRTESTARERLDYLVYSAMREELGKNQLTEVVRNTNRFVDHKSEVELGEQVDVGMQENPMRTHIERGREKVMEAVTARADQMAAELGIRIIDVRIKRADLLPENLQAVFKRMRAERSRISTGYRSEGQKQMDIIQSSADRQVMVLLAEAERNAMILRGEGDAEAARIYADAFGANPEFYEFMRSLEVAEEFTPAGTQFVLGLDSSLYRVLRQTQPLEPSP